MKYFDMPQEIASPDDITALLARAQDVDFRCHKNSLVPVAMFCGNRERVRRSVIFWRYTMQDKPTIRSVVRLGVKTESDNEICMLVHEFGLQPAHLVQEHEPLISDEYALVPVRKPTLAHSAHAGTRAEARRCDRRTVVSRAEDSRAHLTARPLLSNSPRNSSRVAGQFAFLIILCINIFSFVESRQIGVYPTCRSPKWSLTGYTEECGMPTMTSPGQITELEKKLARRGRWLLMNPFAKHTTVELWMWGDWEETNDGLLVRKMVKVLVKRGIRRIKLGPRDSQDDYYYTDRGELLFRYTNEDGQVVTNHILLGQAGDAEIAKLLRHL